MPHTQLYIQLIYTMLLVMTGHGNQQGGKKNSTNKHILLIVFPKKKKDRVQFTLQVGKEEYDNVYMNVDRW